MAEGERLTLLEGLGVSYESAEQVEYGVLQKAFQEHDALRGGDDETQKPGVAEDPSAGSNADHSQELLRSLQEELDAVQSALDALNSKGDTSVKNEGGGGSSKLAAKTAKTVGKDKPSKRKSKTATSEAVQKQVSLDGITAGPVSETAQRLQVALLQSRLSSLKQKQQILLDKQKNADRTLPHPATTMHSQASALKLLDEDDLFCAIETSGVRGNQPGLIETERDRMIRQGLLTPFDRMEGYERTMMPSKTNVTLGGAQHDVQGDASSWLHRGGIGHLKDQVGKAGKPLEDILKDKSDKTKALVRDRPTALLVPANQLPALEPDARRLPPQFWRQSASSKKFDARPSQSLAVKRKRHTTLPRRNKGKQARKACTDKSASSCSEKDEDGNDLISVDNSSEEEQGIVKRAGDITAASTSGQRRKDAAKNVLGRSSGRDNMGKDRDENDSEYSPSQLTSGDTTRQNEKREFDLKKEDNVVIGHEGDSSSSGDVELIEEDLRQEVGKKKQKEEVEEEEEDDAGEYDDADSDYFEKRMARSLVTSRKSRRCLQQNVQRRNSSNRIAVANQMTHGLSPPGGSASLASLQCDVICPGGGVAADTTREACLSNGAQAEQWPTEAIKSEEHEANLSTDLIKDENYESGAEDSEQEHVKFDGGFKIPTYLYSRLFPYQQTAVKWLWELRNQRTGGILGDEMGLGKTVEITAFLAGLLHSGLYRPSLIVCPATVLRQWLREVRLWAPEFRVIMFHDSARGGRGGATRLSKEHLVLKATRESPTGLLLTTYESLRAHRHLLLPVRWGTVILDEGHKIRNPDADITLVAKQLQTVHRIIMSGSPIQNRLSELWSLFDFIFPGRLGTLPVFQAQFSIPIQVGGYTNASPLQVTTAYKCAVLLRDLIAPYLLRRRKVDVNAQLPKKTEQVLFCTLTAEQCDLYRSYLASDEVNSIIAGNMNALAGIDVLRKVCNHPDLLERATEGASQDYGNPTRSGKLTVLLRLLQHWQQGGHKALLFTQTQQMLDILEKVIRSNGYSYHRMDGSTNVAMRPRLMDDFNKNPDIFLFLLTTKVGGLGVNLTGADRVLLYDPDWNPSNDMQARERAWRIGQTREVVIYRLITSGTIEEKVYHRQIFKNFLTNKILQDPRQKRFFATRDIRDLFTLGDQYSLNGVDGEDNHLMTETARIFSALGGKGVEVEPRSTMTPAIESGVADARDMTKPDSTKGQGVIADNETEATQGRQMASHGQPDYDGLQNASNKQRLESSAGAGPSTTRLETDDIGSRRFNKGPGVKTARLGKRSKVRESSKKDSQDATANVCGEGADEEPGDSKILKDLFDGAGVLSLVDHQRIESANDPEVLAVDREAQRVAQRAAEALKRSREACLRSPLTSPTWTGRNGGAGAPSGTAASRPSSNTAAGNLRPGQQGGTATEGTAGRRRFGNVTNPSLIGRRVDSSISIGTAAVSGGARQLQEPGAHLHGTTRLGSAREEGGQPMGTAVSSDRLLTNIRQRQRIRVPSLNPGGAEDAGRRSSTAVPLGQRASFGSNSTENSMVTLPASRDDDIGGMQSAAPTTADALIAAPTTADALMAGLITFFEAKGGEASSSEVVGHFRDKVPESYMPLFRQVLKSVATLKKRLSGSAWKLNPEFQA